jgi:hypothetical protein
MRKGGREEAILAARAVLMMQRKSTSEVKTSDLPNMVPVAGPALAASRVKRGEDGFSGRSGTSEERKGMGLLLMEMMIGPKAEWMRRALVYYS